MDFSSVILPAAMAGVCAALVFHVIYRGQRRYGLLHAARVVAALREQLLEHASPLAEAGELYQAAILVAFLEHASKAERAKILGPLPASVRKLILDSEDTLKIERGRAFVHAFIHEKKRP